LAQAPLPSRPIERGRPGPGLLAHVLVSKYADHLPLYRQSQIFDREGIDLDRSTLADWVGKSTALLEPLADAIGRHYTGAAALLGSLPKAGWLLADRGYDADWFREALKDKGIKVCIPGRKSRKKAVKYDKRRYKRRNRIEIMFGRLKDWRRVATRYDRCPETFFSAIMLAATVLFWL